MKAMKLMTITASVALLSAGVASAEGMKHSKVSDDKLMKHTTIQFSPGSAVLSESHQAMLRKLVRSVRTNRDIDQITIAAWSDKALPATGKTLSDADRNLADKRAEAIKDIVRMELGVTDVDLYNMAEPANWLARTFNTSDDELKSIFGRTAEEIPVTREEFQMIKSSGAPGKAVVVAEFDLDNTVAPAAAPAVTP